MNWQERISVDPAIRSGKPCIRGTRITVYDVLEYLAGGMSEDEILSDFPDLTRDDLRACLVFASTREEVRTLNAHDHPELTVANNNDFEREIEMTRENKDLMNLLEWRAKQPGTVSLDEAKDLFD